jgi:hypothetical protein
MVLTEHKSTQFLYHAPMEAMTPAALAKSTPAVPWDTAVEFKRSPADSGTEAKFPEQLHWIQADPGRHGVVHWNTCHSHRGSGNQTEAVRITMFGGWPGNIESMDTSTDDAVVFFKSADPTKGDWCSEKSAYEKLQVSLQRARAAQAARAAQLEAVEMAQLSAAAKDYLGPPKY